MAQQILTKQDKPKILDYFPTKQYGKNGDIVISRIRGKGVFFCIKVAGAWYAQTTMQPLNKINDVFIKHLTSEKITLKNINESEITEKFLVSSNGNIRYRTGNQVIEDLGIKDINSFDIAYKTAYCSLEQYSDKETCEANGGTWYYSENDSHDSISSTAENQLLTVSESIGKVDAESTLTYDGSALHIKYNSDYDDNWRTSATTNLLKLSYDSGNFGNIGMNSYGNMTFRVEEGNSFWFYEGASARMQFNADDGILKLYNPDNVLDYFSIDIDDNGVTEIKTYDTDATAGHLTLVPDGDLILDPASQKTIINATDGLYFDGGSDTYIYESGADNLRFVAGGTTMLDITEAVTNSFNIQSSHLTVDATKKIIFDGSVLGHTYITEFSDDVLDFYVGTDKMLSLDEANDKISLAATNWVAGTVSGATITEFSAANSAYAGMILGYTDIGLDEATAFYNLTTSYVVPTDELGVTFTAPPSGNVEIFIQIGFDVGSSNAGDLYLGLSTANATSGYSQLADFHESEVFDAMSRGALRTIRHSWTLTGLTAGTSYTRWLGAKSSSTTGTPHLQWGGNATGYASDFIMKAIALPETIST